MNLFIIKCCCLARTTHTHRRSMGLPPAQGHNNLRLNTTTNYYPKYRLDKTQYNKTRKPKHTFHTHLLHPSISSSTYPSYSLQRTPIAIERRPSNQNSQKRAQIAPTDQRASHSSRSAHRLRASSSSLTNQRTFNRNRSFQLENPSASREMQKYLSSNCKQSIRGSVNVRNCSSCDVNAPIISNMPLVNVNSSIVLVNHSPFGLRDPRVGIFHHCSQSISYF